MKLFRAEATVVVYLFAEDRAEAEREAAGAFRDEIRDNPPREHNSLMEVTTLRQVDRDWLDSIPRGDFAKKDEMTCREFVEFLPTPPISPEGKP